MKFRKIISAVLCVAIVAGFTGCTGKNKQSPEDSIDSIMEDYTEALQGFDADGVLDLTKWDDDDSSYKDIDELLDLKSYDKDVQGCYKIIASKMKVEYDIDDLKLKETKASLDVTYKYIDWKMTFIRGDVSYEGMESKLKELKPSIETDGKISFVLEDGEWKISKITALDEAFAFTDEKPLVMTTPDPTEPTSTETSSTEPSTDDISWIIDAALYHMQANEDSIRAAENTFHDSVCGVYDMNDDGIPEIYYLASDNSYGGEVYNADLYIGVYNEFAGEYVRQIVVPGVIYMAADGGCYMIYVTDNEVLITHCGGEESLYRVKTEVFDFNWKSVGRYERNIYYDYDPETNVETYSYEYFLNGNPMSQYDYNAQMTDYINRTKLVLGRDYTPLSSDIEYPLVGKSFTGMMSYDEAVKYISSLKYTV